MKTRHFGIGAIAMIFGGVALSQSTLVFDQQSATSGNATGGARIIEQQPLGQSFTPSLSGVGFVQFQFRDFDGNLGATVYVNLRENSIGGNILASSAPVFMNNGFRGNTIFFFSGNVLVTPGTTYYFQPVLQAGDDTDLMGDVYNYSGGTLFTEGVATMNPALDFWFREGIVVPEPSVVWLALAGAGLLFCCTRRSVRQRAR